MSCPECGATTVLVTKTYHFFGLKILTRKMRWCLLCGHEGK